MLEIAVAIPLRATRAFCPTMHSAPCPTRYRRLLARMTGTGLSSASARFG